jgi:hypothetical protein
VFGLLLLLPPAISLADVARFKYSHGSSYLFVELLDDDMAHFEVSAFGPGPDTSQPILTSPMVADRDYAGPSSVSQSGPGGTRLETPELRLTVHADTLCVDVRDKSAGVDLTTICPLSLVETKGLSIAPGIMQNVYGLGEQFVTPGSADGDWVGRTRSPGDAFGNQMVGFGNGAAGNSQFPVMYAVGPQNANYALFLDHVVKQRWALYQLVHQGLVPGLLAYVDGQPAGLRKPGHAVVAGPSDWDRLAAAGLCRGWLERLGCQAALSREYKVVPRRAFGLSRADRACLGDRPWGGVDHLAQSLAERIGAAASSLYTGVRSRVCQEHF